MGIREYSVDKKHISFNIKIGDLVSLRRAIQGYERGREWLLSEPDGPISPQSNISCQFEGKIWRHYGAARITRTTAGRIFFEFE